MPPRLLTRPTRLGVTPLAGAAMLGGLAILTGDSWLLLMASAGLGVTLAAWVLRPRLDGLVVEITTPPRIELGSTLPTQVQARNIGRRAVPTSRVRVHVAGLQDVTVGVPALPPRGWAVVSVPRLAVARGRFHIGTVTVSSSAPLGLVRAERTTSQPTDLTVHPRVVRMQPPPLTLGADGTGPARRSRSGLDVHGIRPWRPGDGAGQVHWRSTARRGRLVVLEREEPSTDQLVICLSGPHGGPDWEPVLSVVASLATAAARSGRTVSLLAPDAARPRWDVLTCEDEDVLLAWCAQVGAVPSVDPGAIGRLARLLGPGTEVMVAAGADRADRAGWWESIRAAGAAAGLRLLRTPPPHPDRGRS